MRMEGQNGEPHRHVGRGSVRRWFADFVEERRNAGKSETSIARSYNLIRRGPPGAGSLASRPSAVPKSCWRLNAAVSGESAGSRRGGRPRSRRRRGLRGAAPPWHRQRGHALRVRPPIARWRGPPRPVAECPQDAAGEAAGPAARRHRVSEHSAEDSTIFRQACRMGLEGVVSKRLSAPYRSGPSRDWIKVKNPDSPAMARHREERW